MKQIVRTINLDKLIAHPDNPNRMSETIFNKLVRNIERTDLYEPIVVRPHPKIEESYEIINGHHRVKALQKLSRDSADCVIWNVDDEQTAILLATLNRLTGSDIIEKKQQLFRKLTKSLDAGSLSKLLPATKGQIEALVKLKRPVLAPAGVCDLPAQPLVFFVTDEQSQIIDKAISIASKQVTAATSAETKAAALTLIAEHWSESCSLQ